MGKVGIDARFYTGYDACWETGDIWKKSVLDVEIIKSLCAPINRGTRVTRGYAGKRRQTDHPWGTQGTRVNASEPKRSLGRRWATYDQINYQIYDS